MHYRFSVRSSSVIFSLLRFNPNIIMLTNQIVVAGHPESMMLSAFRGVIGRRFESSPVSFW